MFKRALASLFWFVAAWELGSAIGLVIGIDSDLLPATLALIAASFAGLDPLHTFRWQHSPAMTPVATASQGQPL